MQQRSSIYVQCPGCRDRALADHVALLCAACGFDYRTLAPDERALAAFVVENLELGPMGQLGALDMHRRITGLGAPESVQRVRAIGLEHGIVLPDAATPPTFARLAMIGIVVVVGFIGALALAMVVLT